MTTSMRGVEDGPRARSESALRGGDGGELPCCDGAPCTSPACRCCASECHVSTCDKDTGQCAEVPVADGADCDDESACTQLDRCQVGICVGEKPVVCGPPNECQEPEGTCNEATGVCDYLSKEDGAACHNGTCDGGTCVKDRECSVDDDCRATEQCSLAGTCEPRSPIDSGGCACAVGGGGSALLSPGIFCLLVLGVLLGRRCRRYAARPAEVLP